MWSYCTKPHQACIRCATFNALLSCPLAFQYFNPLQNGNATMKIVLQKRRFFVLNWLSWQHPLSDRQVNAKFIKPLHSSTNPENLVENPSSIPENSWLRGRPLKIRKNVGKIYSLPGRHTGLARMALLRAIGIPHIYVTQTRQGNYLLVYVHVVGLDYERREDVLFSWW